MRLGVLITLVVLVVGGCSAPETPKADLDAPFIIGSRGQAPGKFSFPRGIDILPDGRIALADKTGRIQILTRDGEPITEWILPKIDNGTPTGLVFDTTDPTTTTLLVADTHNSLMFRYSLDGKLIKTFGEYGGQPGHMIYPTDVAVDPAGHIYVTEYGENDRVLKFDRDGNFIKEWGGFGTAPGQFQRPLGLIFKPPDRIIVADSCNHRIQIFTTEGELISTWGQVGDGPGQMTYPYDLALGADGLLYVCEYGNNRIQCFDLAGKSHGIYGRAGSRPGEFAAPWGIAVAPDGLFYVADTNNHRLQRIDLRNVIQNGTSNR